MWDVSAEVRGVAQWTPEMKVEIRAQLRIGLGETLLLEKKCAACLSQSKVCLDCLINVSTCPCMRECDANACVGVGPRACDCAKATRILSCHISVHVLEEKAGPQVGFCGSSKPVSYTRDWVGKKRKEEKKKKKKLCCFCQSFTQTKATTCSRAACPLCKTAQVV